MHDPELKAFIVDALSVYDKTAQQKIRREIQLKVKRACCLLICAAFAGGWGSYPFVNDTLLRYFLFCLAALCLYQGFTLIVAALSEDMSPSSSEVPRQPEPRRLRRVV